MMFKIFWDWYNRNLLLATSVAAFLFLLQIVHLYWLTTHVVFLKILGFSLFDPSGVYEALILVVDYLEIPAIITTSLVYINDLRKGKKFKAWLYLLLLNSQWLHILWITDEYVAEQFLGIGSFGMPFLLSMVAIGIDYLEIPVIVDTLKRIPDLLKEKLNKA